MNRGHHSECRAGSFIGKRALILDGDTRTALAVVRSLGDAGFEVNVAAHRSTSLGGSSRFTSREFLSPDPNGESIPFQTFLRSVLQEIEPDYLLPVTNASLVRTLPLRHDLPPHTLFPFPTADTLAQVLNKARLLAIAEELGIPVPVTVGIPPVAERDHALFERIRNFTYPACLKLADSDSELDGKLRKSAVFYPRDAREVEAIVSGEGEPWRREVPFLLQEFIPGEGIGVFAICRSGRSFSLFAHRRLLEKPPQGGVSVLAESIPLSRAPVEDAKRLLEYLRWDGSVMVEFKRGADGRCYLMELNPRFWGSLQLAIDCGINYPVLLYELFALGKEIQDTPYPVGQRLRWPLGMLDHLLLQLRRDPWETLRSITLSNSLHLFEPRTRWDVFRLNDLTPFAVELWRYFSTALLPRNPQ